MIYIVERPHMCSWQILGIGWGRKFSPWLRHQIIIELMEIISFFLKSFVVLLFLPWIDRLKPLILPSILFFASFSVSFPSFDVKAKSEYSLGDVFIKNTCQGFATVLTLAIRQYLAALFGCARTLTAPLKQPSSATSFFCLTCTIICTIFLHFKIRVTYRPLNDIITR